MVLDHEVEALSDRLDDLFFRKDGPSRSEQRWLVERLETTRARRARILGLVPRHAPPQPFRQALAPALPTRRTSAPCCVPSGPPQSPNDAPAPDSPPQDTTAVARTILDGFERHYRLFRTTSAGAKQRFERADWPAAAAAHRARIDLYDRRVYETVLSLKEQYPKPCPTRSGRE